MNNNVIQIAKTDLITVNTPGVFVVKGKKQHIKSVFDRTYIYLTTLQKEDKSFEVLNYRGKNMFKPSFNSKNAVNDLKHWISRNKINEINNNKQPDYIFMGTLKEVRHGEDDIEFLTTFYEIADNCNTALILSGADEDFDEYHFDENKCVIVQIN